MSIIQVDLSQMLRQDNRQTYFVANQIITANGQPMASFAGNFYCEPGDIIQLQGEITDVNGDVVTDISLPLKIKMPVVRHANGQPTTDEIYLNLTIQEGVITASGKIDTSGDWMISVERNNEALQRIGASWKLSALDINILV